MARKFLYLIAVIIVLIILGAIALAIWSREATELALVPRGEFVEQKALAANAYQDPAMWYSRPGLGNNDPARYQPAIAEPAPSPEAAAASPDTPAAERSLATQRNPLETSSSRAADPVDAEATPDFAVFFVHPTSYIPLALTEDAQWNAELGDETAEGRARLFLRGMASAFNRADEIWAPRYRQAVAGAFLTDQPEAGQAIDAAYGDVREAFAYFVESIDPDLPIVLAGHSQGSLHLLRLMREEIAGTQLEQRIAASYPIGWPISVEDDLPALPFEACEEADQSACIVTWSSFAEPFDTSMLMSRFVGSESLSGTKRGDGPILCVNPLTGTVGGTAPASANLGTLVPDAGMSSAELVPEAVPARCDEQGLLLIGDPPDLGQGVLPGNNYHVYDIPLFWANLQADVVRRVATWQAAP
jgi:hypothetical protein